MTIEIKQHIVDKGVELIKILPLMMSVNQDIVTKKSIELIKENDLEKAVLIVIELVEYVSYSEIVGAIGLNRSVIRGLCDEVFEGRRMLEALNAD